MALEEQGDGKHRLYNGASTRLARGCPLYPSKAPGEEGGSLEASSRLPHGRYPGKKLSELDLRKITQRRRILVG